MHCNYVCYQQQLIWRYFMNHLFEKFLTKSTIPSKDKALPGRDKAISISGIHAVNNAIITRTPNANESLIYVGMGCFWGAERRFWQMQGVTVTAVGYAGGYTPNPTYEEVCSGQTGHSEVVKIIFDHTITTLEDILKTFWESHDPTQGLRQGNDVGSQYRSVVYTTSTAQANLVEKSAELYQAKLLANGYPMITTEREPIQDFYYAEEYHQQYLSKNPNGYCGLSGTGVNCPVGLSL